jgi:hypothetical protein
LVRDPVGTLAGLGKSFYNNTIGGLAGLAVKGGAYLEAGDMLMSGSVLGIDTRDEAMAIMNAGRSGEQMILAHPRTPAEQVGTTLGDLAALGAAATSMTGRPLARALDAFDTYEVSTVMRTDLANQDFVYRLVKSTDLVHYENANAITGRGGAPTYFSLDTAPSMPEHMLGAQMNPAYGPYDTLLRIPSAELVSPQVPRLRGYDPVQPPFGREYSTSAYPKFGSGGYRQIMGTTRSYSSAWVMPQKGTK